MLSAIEIKILDSARLEFIEKGKAGARMKSIAQRAGVNKALLHYYFRSKEKLYQEVLNNILSKVWTTMQENLSKTDVYENDLRGIIRIFVATFISTVQQNPDFPRMFLRELADGSKTIPLTIDHAIQSVGNLPKRIFGAVKASAARGEIRPAGIGRDAVRFIWASMSRS